nr:2-hydroxyglutaryl-CoA dehydratase [Desulfobacterales bacterium]
MYFAGIDIGSTVTKIVILDDKESLVSKIIRYTAPEHRRFANKLMEEVLEKAELTIDDIEAIVATGYGRVSVPFADKKVTEITCHAIGVSCIFPHARTIIDIGGQDSKGIKVINGRVVDFVMNDKCAAGTGRFLDVIAEALGSSPHEMGEYALRSSSPVTINSICTVFAEQEVVSYLADGVLMEDIAAGIYDAIVARIHGMVRRIGIEQEIIMTGGVAKSRGLIKTAKKRLGRVLTPPEPLITGALGAAIFAKRLFEDSNRKGTLIDKSKRRMDRVTFFDQAAR